MKKIVSLILLFVLALIVGYLVLNQIDARPYQSSISAPLALTQEDFEKTNGFYRLWTLIEPKEVDIETDEAILPYRRLFDPSFNNDLYIREFNVEKYKEKYAKIRSKELRPFFSAMDYGIDWLPILAKYHKQLEKAKEEYEFMLVRYEKLIRCNSFTDFTLARSDSPLPNLLAWLHTAKLSITLDIMAAQEGNAPEAAAHLLRHLSFAKNASSHSRMLITSLIAKAVARYSIWALNAIMNQEDCPPQVFDLVYEGTKSISSDEFGSKNPLMWEAQVPLEPDSGLSDRILYWFLYQKNRTTNHRLRIMERYIGMEKIPPYQWRMESIELTPFTSKSFWWLQNPIGKRQLDITLPNLVGVVYKEYQLKTAHDMLHIAADLHRVFDPARSVQSQLNDLPSYREFLDPCSGKPYMWNNAKKILYSIGIDRSDNLGETKNISMVEGSDYILPIITFAK